ncbi:MAG: DnaA regulatory inactivator Hda [Pseudomonadota bacterium]|uniref:DnaA regulatory inactivator Hda n=1 Tax=Alcanivorax sp. TaxID=1872427 RepID=UPI00243DC792|nr:DnaA regulatory inactivator Hda [Alcanivorax sp.]MED5239143.1 DnaA regulatory inactivator Hda [Pseudomonadota bacterium]MEE3321795.1 DnaA regulatory inactivator Hda [Pseudomonadota bacterium]
MVAQLPLALQLREGNDLSNFVAGQNGALFQGIRETVVGTDRQACIWGPEGQGKSHLLEGAVRLAQQHGMNACLLPAEELLPLSPDVLESMEQFALLAIDDCQHFAGEPRWEEALFHLYNRLMARGGRLLVTANASPSAMGLMLPDLATRLAAGPVYRLQPLEDDGLETLLVERARARGLRLEPEVAHFIVLRSERSPGGLVSLLNRLDRLALAQQRSVTIPFVKDALGW